MSGKKKAPPSTTSTTSTATVPAPVVAPAPVQSNAVAKEQVATGSEQAQGTGGQASAASSGGGGAAAAPTTQTYLCTLGGHAFTITCGDTPNTMALAGFQGSFGHLQIETLNASLSRGKAGPNGKVWGSAVLAGCVSCSVSGAFEGTALKLRVSFEGDHPLWSGMNLTRVGLRVGPSGVSGSASARYVLPSVEGTVTLGWADGKLVANTTKTVTLPWLGPVVFQVTVSGFDFGFAAEAPALAALGIPGTSVQVTSGRVAADQGRLGGEVAATVTDDTGALSGGVQLDVLGVSQVQGSGTMALDLPGLAAPTTAVMTVPSGGPAVLSLPRVEISAAEGAVQGAISVAWSSEAGLSLVPLALTATLPGTDGVAVDFLDLSYTAATGLSGSASVSLDQLGVAWLGSEGVVSVDGALEVSLANDRLVAGSGVATVQAAWGSVEVRAQSLESTGLVASMTATVIDLGASVQLSAPLVLVGTHEGGVTTFQANGLGFVVDLGAADLKLSGLLANTVFDPAQGGLTGAASLDLATGPMGLAHAEARVEEGVLTLASFTFPEPRFRYPADAPVLEGTVQGALAYEDGSFSGGVEGTATLTALDEQGEQGTIVVSASATEAGGLRATVEGQDVRTPLLVVDRLYLRIDEQGLVSDVQVSTRDDLPVELVGGVKGGWGEQGFTAQGGFEVRSKEGESPRVSGHLEVGYDGARGLWAKGTGEADVDDRIGASAKLALGYEDGALTLSGGAHVEAFSKEPIIDFSQAFMGKSYGKPKGAQYAAGGRSEGKGNMLTRILDRQMAVQVAGIPNVIGLRGTLGAKVGGVGIYGRLSGFDLGVDLAPWDVLGQVPPKLSLEGGFGTSDDLGVQTTLGIDVGLEAYLYKLALRVIGRGDLGLGLAVVAPRFASTLSWDPEGQLTGDVDVTLPLRFQMVPSLKFWAEVGAGKLFAMKVPGTKYAWTGRAFEMDVGSVGFGIPLEDMLGTSASEPTPTEKGGLDVAALSKQILDANATIKDMVRYFAMAVDVVDERVDEITAMWEGGLEFWDTLFEGGSLEEAQRNQHHLERMMNENTQAPRDIARLRGNLEALMYGGPGRTDEAKVFATMDELYRTFVSFRVNMDLLEPYGILKDPDHYDAIRRSELDLARQVSALRKG